MSDYDADVQHLAEYLLGDPPYRAADPAHHDRRVHALAMAVQRAIDAWLAAHPLGTTQRRRWARVHPDVLGG